MKYAAEVAAILHGQQCEASIIDAMALARMAPDGGGEPVKGWDAANVVVEWPDLAALRKAAHGLVKRFEATPHDNTEAGDEIKRLAGLGEVAKDSGHGSGIGSSNGRPCPGALSRGRSAATSLSKT